MDAIKNIIIEVEKLKSNQDFKGAISLLETGIQKYANDYRLYEEVADIYLYEAKFGKAMKAIEFALEINAWSATGNYLKGFILLSQDKVKESINFLEKSNKFMANNAEVLRNLGWAYTMVWETNKGIIILKRALNLSPEDELITEDLAMALIGVGEVNEGHVLLQKIGKK